MDQQSRIVGRYRNGARARIQYLSLASHPSNRAPVADHTNRTFVRPETATQPDANPPNEGLSARGKSILTAKLRAAFPPHACYQSSILPANRDANRRLRCGIG